MSQTRSSSFSCACVQVCPWFIYPLVSLGLVLNFLLYVIVSHKTGTSGLSVFFASLPPNDSIRTNNETKYTLATPTLTTAIISTRVADPHEYEYIINAPEICISEKPILLLAAVCSAPANTDMRIAIRATWGLRSVPRTDVRVVFFLGRPKDPSLQALVADESNQFSDIIQEDFIDTYYNLTLKSVMMLKWATLFCPEAAFVLKADDDMFVHLPNLMNYLTAIPGGPSGQLFGHLNRRSIPNRSKSSKRYELLSTYHSKYFPSYLSGGAYVMSIDVARRLYETAIKTPLFLVEDVFITGICAKKARILRKDHGSFRFNKNLNHCAYKNGICGHGFTPEELELVWKDVTEGNCNRKDGSRHLENRRVN